LPGTFEELELFVGGEVVEAAVYGLDFGDSGVFSDVEAVGEQA
jgi:hypothetical protein